MADISLTVQDESVQARFWAKVDVREAAQCWPWTGGIQSTGYGSFMLNGRAEKAHRVSAALSGKQINGMVVRHNCDNRRCVNSAHLRPGTIADNNRDMWERGRQSGFAAANAEKTHCHKGHMLLGENVRVTPKGLRACRTCHREHCRDLRARKGAIPRRKGRAIRALGDDR